MLSQDCKYAPLNEAATSQASDDERPEAAHTMPPKSNNPGRLWTLVLVLAILLSNMATAVVYSNLLRPSSRHDCPGARPPAAQHVDHPDQAITDELPTVWTKHFWWSYWGLPDIELNRSSPNAFIHATAANDLWDGIRTDHGMIAVDREWAREQRWPESMYLPKDPNGKQKGVYLLEAYHQLHCLRMIRGAFVELANGKTLSELSHDVAHTSHCFGVLLQHIQCHADNTPLYTFGDRVAGDGQKRLCKSWDALRDYATKHTACYKDGPFDMSLRDHFGHCEEGVPYQDGKDGMP